MYDWGFWARPTEQRENGTFTGQKAPPGNWFVWLVMAGRGYGKTRVGAEMVRHWVENEKVKSIAIVARTAADVRDYCIHGFSGLMSICPPDFYPTYEPSKRRITWPNGAYAITYTSEEPRQLRGLNSQRTWADEVAHWEKPDEAWNQVRLATRIPGMYRPRIVATTTPTPIPLMRKILRQKRVVVTTGSTYENFANLDDEFIESMKEIYEGTRIGRQELHGELLGDTPGALWTNDMIEHYRIKVAPAVQFTRIIVAIDPAVTATEDSSETGIIVAALDQSKHAYILEDLSVRARPMVWARIAINAFERYKADRIVAEVNQGGDMVEMTLKAAGGQNMPYTAVRASRGKHTRAEPVSALYEKGRVHHVGYLEKLEEQMISWVPGDPSPDRMDALVWAVSYLLPTKGRSARRSPLVGLYASRRDREGELSGIPR